jgi:hypothetical protein
MMRQVTIRKFPYVVITGRASWRISGCGRCLLLRELSCDTRARGTHVANAVVCVEAASRSRAPCRRSPVPCALSSTVPQREFDGLCIRLPAALPARWSRCAAAGARFGAGLLSFRYPKVILLAALLWTGALLLFVVVYGPILCRPRVDGRPGQTSVRIGTHGGIRRIPHVDYLRSRSS